MAISITASFFINSPGQWLHLRKEPGIDLLQVLDLGDASEHPLIGPNEQLDIG